MKCHKLAVAFLVCLTAAARLNALNVLAEDDESTDHIVSSAHLAKILVMDKETQIPGLSFRFTLSPVSAIEETETACAVFPGPAGAVFVSSDDVSADGSTASLHFTPSDPSILESNAPEGSAIAFVTPDNKNDEKYVQKNLTIDVSAVVFPASGIYRYVVTESPSEIAGMVNDSNPIRVIDVYVNQSVEHDEVVFVPESIVIRSGAVTLSSSGESDSSVKSQGFTNRYSTHRLSFSKAVSGNQASFKQYFKFSVKLTGTESEYEESIFVKVDGSFDASPVVNMATAYETEDMSKANHTELIFMDDESFVSLAQLRKGKNFYLHSGQSISLIGIPDGLGYQLIEAPEDYTPSVTLTGDAASASESSVTDTALNADVAIDFLNQRSNVLPETGIAPEILLPAAVMLAGLAGAAVLLLRHVRKNKKHG